MRVQEVGDLLVEYADLQVKLKDIDACIQKMREVDFEGLLSRVEFVCKEDKNTQIFTLCEPGVDVRKFKNLFVKEMNKKREWIDEQMLSIERLFAPIGE